VGRTEKRTFVVKFELREKVYKEKVFWNTINAYSSRSVGIHDFTCYRRVGKEKQDSG
jgi:hypothetical protein